MRKRRGDVRRSALAAAYVCAAVVAGLGMVGFAADTVAAEGSDELRGRCLSFSADSSLLAAVTGEPTTRGLVVVWELPAGKVRWVHREPKGVPSVAIAPDGKTLAIGTFGENAKLLDMTDGKVVAELPGHGKAARSVAFSPDGSTLAVGSYDKFINLWDVAARRIRRTLKGHVGWVYAVSFSRDGALLASASEDATARIWKLADGETTLTNRHGSIARRAIFTGDGTTFASVGWDGEATLRDSTTSVLRARFWGQNAIACSPDASLWASDRGRNICVYRVDLRPAARRCHGELSPTRRSLGGRFL